MKRNIFKLLLIAAAVGALPESRLAAQTPDRTVQEEIDPRTTLQEWNRRWLETANPSAIGVQAMPDVGTVQFAGNHVSGNLHRAMESDVMNSWGFGARSYTSLEHLNLWGDFSFLDKHHSGRNWSDNLDPYNGNPYQAGSETKADYKEQAFDFGVKISSKRLWNHLWFGMGLDYGIGDLSRLSDPRSRVQYADITLTPGLVVEIAHHHRLGANFSYRYRKEKNNRYVSKSASGNEFFIYRQEGLGVYTRLLSDHFERRTKGNWLGGEFQYEFNWKDLSLMALVQGARREDTLEDMMKECPGDYADQEWESKLMARWGKGSSRHLASASFNSTRGAAHRNFQELKTEVDPETQIPVSYYETLFTTKSFTHQVRQAQVDYRYLRVKGLDYLWFAGSELMFNQLEDRYTFYVPGSATRTGRLDFQLEGGVRLLDLKGHRLYLEGAAGYHLNLDKEQVFSPDLDKDLIRLNVTEPDFSILTANVTSLDLKLKYLFPLSRTFNGFLSLWGMDWLASGKQHRLMGSVSIGVVQRF